MGRRGWERGLVGGRRIDHDEECCGWEVEVGSLQGHGKPREIVMGMGIDGLRVFGHEFAGTCCFVSVKRDDTVHPKAPITSKTNLCMCFLFSPASSLLEVPPLFRLLQLGFRAVVRRHYRLALLVLHLGEAR